MAEQVADRVRASKIAAAHAGDPLNIAKRPLRGAPEEVLRMATIRKAIKAKERVNGDGIVISGTGLTQGKFREPTISRLISKGKIGQPELMALQEIERVYMALCSQLIVKGYQIREKTSGGGRGQFAPWFAEAYGKRYKVWADDWSKRRRLYGDRTMEVVFDVVMSGRSGKELDTDHGWKHGFGIKLLINGLRDYAAVAGWGDPGMLRQWRDAARSVYPLLRQSAA